MIEQAKVQNISKYYVLGCELYHVFMTENMFIKDKAWTTLLLNYCQYDLCFVYIQAFLTIIGATFVAIFDGAMQIDAKHVRFAILLS